VVVAVKAGSPQGGAARGGRPGAPARAATAPLLLQRPEGQRNWVGLDASGAEKLVRPAQVLCVLPGASPELPGGAEGLAALEARAARECEAEAGVSTASGGEESLLGLAREALDPGEAVGLEEIAALVFGREPPPAEDCYAALALLQADRIHFKGRGALFVPRTDAQAAQLRKQVEAEERAWARVEALAAAALEGPEAPEAAWRAGPHAWGVDPLLAVALGEADAAQRAAAEEILQAAGRQRSVMGAMGLLQRMGVWGWHEQVTARQLGVSENFAPDAEAAAAALDDAGEAAEDPDASNREDLRHLVAVTIDDESTREIDDGLSAEATPDGGVRLWVHVADPTRWVPQRSALDREARRRATTVYLPEGSVPMFPRALATGPFSLVAGRDSCAMTVRVDLSPDGDLRQTAVGPSTVHVTHRLTYEEADALKAGEGDPPPGLQAALGALFRASEIRQRYRSAGGAVDIAMPEANLTVTGSDTREAVVEARAPFEAAAADSARTMVAEMMILAGEVAGLVGAEAGLPLPYRGQNQPVLPAPEELEAIPAGPPRYAAIRRCMTRGLTETAAPVPHYGLGLDHYVQFTSPIRRYTDVLAHYQIKAHLRGEAPPLSAEELAGVVEEVSDTAFQKRSLTWEVEQYWLATYLKQQGPGRLWEGQFLLWQRQEMGLAAVLIEELGVETRVRIDRPLEPGARVTLAVTEAEPRLDGTTVLAFEEVAGASEEEPDTA